MSVRQTFVAKLVDKDGNMKDFYRFSCKKAGTVEKKIRAAMSAENTGLESLFRTFWKRDGVVACEIRATPDGVNEEEKPVLRFSMDWAA